MSLSTKEASSFGRNLLRRNGRLRWLNIAYWKYMKPPPGSVTFLASKARRWVGGERVDHMHLFIFSTPSSQCLSGFLPFPSSSCFHSSVPSPPRGRERPQTWTRAINLPPQRPQASRSLNVPISTASPLWIFFPMTKRCLLSGWRCSWLPSLV